MMVGCLAFNFILLKLEQNVLLYKKKKRSLNRNLHVKGQQHNMILIPVVKNYKLYKVHNFVFVISPEFYYN